MAITEKARALLEILSTIRLEKLADGQVWAEMQMGRHLLVADPSLIWLRGQDLNL